MVYPEGADVNYCRPNCDLCGGAISQPNSAHMTTLRFEIGGEYGDLPSPQREHTGHVCSECDPVDPPKDRPDITEIRYYYSIVDDDLELVMARIYSSGSSGVWNCSPGSAPEEIVVLGNAIAKRVVNPSLGDVAKEVGEVLDEDATRQNHPDEAE